MTSHLDDRRTGRRAAWPLVAAIGAFLFAGAVAAPAAADSNFERGFETELGRILAHEAVNAGKHVLFHGVAHASYPARYEPVRVHRPRRPFYRPVYQPVRFGHRLPKHDHWRHHDHDRDYYRDRDRDRHHRGRERHHRHDRHCRH